MRYFARLPLRLSIVRPADPRYSSLRGLARPDLCRTRIPPARLGRNRRWTRDSDPKAFSPLPAYLSAPPLSFDRRPPQTRRSELPPSPKSIVRTAARQEASAIAEAAPSCRAPLERSRVLTSHARSGFAGESLLLREVARTVKSKLPGLTTKQRGQLPRKDTRRKQEPVNLKTSPHLIVIVVDLTGHR